SYRVGGIPITANFSQGQVDQSLSSKANFHIDERFSPNFGAWQDPADPDHYQSFLSPFFWSYLGSAKSFDIDWGDGSQTSTTSIGALHHLYSNEPTEYDIIVITHV